MNCGVIWNIAKSDILERIRRFSFIAVCALSVFLAFMSVPDVGAPIVSIVMEPNVFAQGSNPSWVPIAIALCGGLLFAIIGFTFVNSNIQEDRETGNLFIWQVMGMRKCNYIIGKFLSNIILLTCNWALTIIGAAVMILLRFPNQKLSFYDFFTPFLAIYPSLLFVSAFAVLLNATFGKRMKHLSSLGISILFILFIINYSTSSSDNLVLKILDFSGYRWIMDSINENVFKLIGRTVQETGILVLGGMFAESNGTMELVFHGLSKKGAYLNDKLGLILFCIGMLFVAFCFLDTEENSISKQNIIRNRNRNPKKQHYLGLMFSEIKIVFKNQTKKWWFFIIGLWMTTLVMDLRQTQNYIWIIIAAISVGILSTLGCKEHESRIIDYMIVIDGALLKGALYSYIIGVCYMLTISMPVIIRTIISHSNNYLGYVAFALFIPALSSFLGEITKNRKSFEAIYLLICFILINKPDLLFWNQFILFMFTTFIIFITATLWKRKLY